MMGPELFATYCRPDGRGLPYRDLPAKLKRIIVQALREAWARLCERVGTRVTELDEDQTTTLLIDELRRLLDARTLEG